ncbi:MAG: hypothetical protein K0U74_10515 [Alphaproteobacteria bacterium]|nr:hypothetical protein [Alphaproteobacteria bacterium]
MTAGLGHNARNATVSVEARLFNSLQKYAGPEGWRSTKSFPAGATIYDLAAEFGLPPKEIFLVMKNGRDVTAGLVGAPANLNAALEDGDVIAFSGPVPYSYGLGAPVV